MRSRIRALARVPWGILTVTGGSSNPGIVDEIGGQNYRGNDFL